MSDVDGFWDELFITQEEVEKRKLQPLEKEFIIENRETAFNDVVRRLAKVYGINLRSGKEVQDKARLETARQIFAELEPLSVFCKCASSGVHAAWCPVPAIIERRKKWLNE